MAFMDIVRRRPLVDMPHDQMYGVGGGGGVCDKM